MTPPNSGGPLAVRSLQSADAPVLARMLAEQPAEYMRHFTPFAFDTATIGRLLAERVADVYAGLFCDGELAAFYMLRGWDEGYDVPAYGVTVSERFRGRGLGALTIELSKTICRLRGARRLMLKVHPDNAAARGLYERAGFRQTGVDERNGNLVMHYDVAARSDSARPDLPDCPTAAGA